MTRWYSRSWPTVGPGTGCPRGRVAGRAVGRAVGREGAVERERRYGSRAVRAFARRLVRPRHPAPRRRRALRGRAPPASPCPDPAAGAGSAAAGAGSAAAGRPPRFTQSMQGFRLDHAPFGAPAAAEARIAPQAERGEPRNLSWTRTDRLAAPRSPPRPAPRPDRPDSLASSAPTITMRELHAPAPSGPRSRRPRAAIPSSMRGRRALQMIPGDSRGRAGPPVPSAAARPDRISVSDVHSGISECGAALAPGRGRRASTDVGMLTATLDATDE